VRESVPAVVRRHRRRGQLDRAISFREEQWRVTRDGWTLPGSGFELIPTGDKVPEHGYRVVNLGIHWASFASPEEAIAYVNWRKDGFGSQERPIPS